MWRDTEKAYTVPIVKAMQQAVTVASGGTAVDGMAKEGLLRGDIYTRTRMARNSQPSTALDRKLSRQNTRAKACGQS